MYKLAWRDYIMSRNRVPYPGISRSSFDDDFVGTVL